MTVFVMVTVLEMSPEVMEPPLVLPLDSLWPVSPWRSTVLVMCEELWTVRLEVWVTVAVFELIELLPVVSLEKLIVTSDGVGITRACELPEPTELAMAMVFVTPPLVTSPPIVLSSDSLCPVVEWAVTGLEICEWLEISEVSL